MKGSTVYSVVVSIYNEEVVIYESYRRIKVVMDCTEGKYEIIFVNDGSSDKTRDLVEEVCSNDEKIKLVNF